MEALVQADVDLDKGVSAPIRIRRRRRPKLIESPIPRSTREPGH
jgi:hypothetical protein